MLHRVPGSRARRVDAPPWRLSVVVVAVALSGCTVSLERGEPGPVETASYGTEDNAPVDGPVEEASTEAAEELPPPEAEETPPEETPSAPETPADAPASSSTGNDTAPASNATSETGAARSGATDRAPAANSTATNATQTNRT